MQPIPIRDFGLKKGGGGFWKIDFGVLGRGGALFVADFGWWRNVIMFLFWRGFGVRNGVGVGGGGEVDSPGGVLPSGWFLQGAFLVVT